MTTPPLAGALLGGALGLSLALLVAAVAGWRPARRVNARPAVPRRWWAAAAVALAVAVATRWPVASLAAGALVVLWPRMFGAGAAASARIQLVEAVATWTESLRDSIAGAIGLEEAIRHSLPTAPAVLRAPLDDLDARLRVQVPLAEALLVFGDDLDDASADLVVAALCLNASLRGPGLVATLSALATSARDELDVRRKIEEGRRALRRTATLIVGVTAAFAAGLAVLSRDYVEPYTSAEGQVVLAVVLAVFAAGLAWIRSAAAPPPVTRFLARTTPVRGERGAA